MMQKSVNLFALTRINDFKDFYRYEKELSHRDSHINIQKHELTSLKNFVSLFSEEDISILDNFYYSYTIPQISKEFDLLKITDKTCLNIELKKEKVSDDKIYKQLEQNKYYLSHLNVNTKLFTFISDSNEFFELTINGLEKASFEDVIYVLFDMMLEKNIVNIDYLFSPTKFLVSPINNPDRFINGYYYLTSQQEEIKKEILDTNIARFGISQFIRIEGEAGTGKTLLIYDIAKALAKENTVLIIHCAHTNEGQKLLTKRLTNISIVEPKKITSAKSLENFDIIIVDEAQRIYNEQFDFIIEATINNNLLCIFSIDPEQVLSKKEHSRNIYNSINQIKDIKKYKLTDRIRYNKDIIFFAKTILNLNLKYRINFDGITIIYTDNTNDAESLIKYYMKNNYTCLHFTGSNFTPCLYDSLPYDFDTHNVIGQEFDNVVIHIGTELFYNPSKKLDCIDHPSKDYLYTKMLYQSITRVREKLVLIIDENIELFNDILTIYPFETNKE